MRTIKFRGKRVDKGNWVYGFYVFRPDGKHLIYWQPFEEASQNTYHEVTPETVGQFTGLLDKNGTEIFEGDLVKIEKVSVFETEPYFITREIIWGAKGGFHAKDTTYDSLAEALFGLGAEVIGNIHETKQP